MTTEYHDDNTDEENSYFRTKEPVLSLSTVSRFRRWLFHGVTAILILIIIIALGATNSGIIGRLWFLEAGVSNMTDQLIKSQQMNKETARNIHGVQFAVERNKEDLISVGEAVKHLSSLESLRNTVATMRCQLDRLINNNTAVGCCPLDWLTFETSCYFFSRMSLSWDEARDWCNAQDSHLAILHQEKEWKFVTSHTSGMFFWIGLTDERTGEWEWVNQTPYEMNRIHWVPGQPDDWTGHHHSGEDCAHIHHDGRLNDIHCTMQLHYICQRHTMSS